VEGPYKISVGKARNLP